MHKWFRAFLYTTAASAIACSSAHAQTADNDAAPAGVAAVAVEDIIVTARRGNELLQDVPASITVFTEKALQQSGVTDTQELANLTAGVTIVTSTAEAGDTQVNIRGLNGARDAENNVALVVDGILKTNTAQLNQIQGRLVQAEVLKGPQGVLFAPGEHYLVCDRLTRTPSRIDPYWVPVAVVAWKLEFADKIETGSTF